MASEPLINIVDIQKGIKKAHAVFMDNYGPQIEKVVADQRLMSEIIFARLYRILICFKEENIIDDYSIVREMPFKKLQLSKKGYNSYIYVSTNGSSIILEGYGFSLSDFTSDVTILKKKFRNVQEGTYDWTQFSKELLDYIHSVIYERKEASETKINTMFEKSFEDDVKIIDKTKKNDG